LRRGWILAAGLLLLVSMECRAESYADSVYSIARQAYAHGDYLTARLEAQAALEDTSKMTRKQILEFRELLGSSFAILKQRDDAIRVFRELLALDPFWQLDEDAPPIVKDAFDEAYRRYAAYLALPPSQRLSSGELQFGASWRSLALPGWGQFYKGQKVRGAVAVSLQVLSLVALAVLQSEVNRRHDIYHEKEGNDAASAYDEYQRVWRARNVVGYVALGVYIVTYLDALYSPAASK